MVVEKNCSCLSTLKAQLYNLLNIGKETSILLAQQTHELATKFSYKLRAIRLSSSKDEVLYKTELSRGMLSESHTYVKKDLIDIRFTKQTQEMRFCIKLNYLDACYQSCTLMEKKI